MNSFTKSPVIKPNVQANKMTTNNILTNVLCFLTKNIMDVQLSVSFLKDQVCKNGLYLIRNNFFFPCN